MLVYDTLGMCDYGDILLGLATSMAKLFRQVAVLHRIKCHKVIIRHYLAI